MGISFGYLRNKSFLQLQFSCSRPWCILQHSLFPSLAAQLPKCTFFFPYLGKMTEGNTKYLLLFPVPIARDWFAFFRVYCKVVDSSLFYAFAMPTPHTTHMLHSCFFLEIGISFCIWDKLTGNGTLLYWHHLCIARALEAAEKQECSHYLRPVEQQELCQS